MEDIIMFSNSFKEHINNLKTALRTLRNANLKIQLDKSEFLRKGAQYSQLLYGPIGRR